MAPRRRLPRSRSSRPSALRRLVITVCPRERGAVVLPVERGDRARRLDARAIARALRELVAARQLEERVGLREGCAGGCSRPGPNVDVTIHLVPRPGEKPNHVAVGWKTYVYSLASLDCLAAIIDENLRPDGEPAPFDPPLHPPYDPGMVSDLAPARPTARSSGRIEP